VNILLAVDGSKYSRKAARYLAAHATMFRAGPRITVLNVHVPIPYGSAAGAVGKKAIERYHREECEAALAPARAILRRARIEHEATWIVGDPAAEIARLARKTGAGLVVMGSHGEGALAGLVLGSVVSKVLARTRVPLLVVR
jgi:nucleotide-binding universal stress UspA family protein